MNHHFYDFAVYNSPPSEIPSEILKGENSKKLLVVLRKGDYTDENQIFLGKILSAVKFNIENDCKLLILPEDRNYSIVHLLEQSVCESVIIFGIQPKEVGLSIETFLYAPFKIAQLSFLIGHPLESIRSSTEKKKLLWNALQKNYPSS